MSNIVISVEHLSKRYQLGIIGTGTLKDDVKIWAARTRGKPNPLGKIGETDYGNRKGNILWALKDVNFTVQHGEALGIIGRNGAGKSTLLKILSRVTTPTSGHIRVKGRIASLLEVGTGFHPDLTGRENIFLNGAIMGMTRTEVHRKLDEIIDFSGVEKFIDTPVKRYSSGMYVRLAFAVAAHLEPEILIVDEVLAVGDAEFQKKCLGKMGDVANEGRTVLFVSHNLGAISDLCKKGIIIKSGSLVFEGETNKAIENYLSEKSDNGQSDLSVLPREKVWEGKHTALSIATKDRVGVIVSEFGYGELIDVAINIQSKVEEKIYVVIGIKDTLGKQLLHFNSRDQQIELLARQGNNNINLRFKNVLNDGAYYLTLWIRDSHFQRQDYLEDCLMFSSNTLALGNNFSKGSIILDCNWAVEQ